MFTLFSFIVPVAAPLASRHGLRWAPVLTPVMAPLTSPLREMGFRAATRLRAVAAPFAPPPPRGGLQCEHVA
jgi:hypothetical protein